MALDLVNWWNVNVSVRESAGGKDGGASRANMRSTVSMAEAERETRINHQQVARRPARPTSKKQGSPEGAFGKRPRGRRSQISIRSEQRLANANLCFPQPPWRAFIVHKWRSVSA